MTLLLINLKKIKNEKLLQNKIEKEIYRIIGTKIKTEKRISIKCLRKERIGYAESKTKTKWNRTKN